MLLMEKWTYTTLTLTKNKGAWICRTSNGDMSMQEAFNVLGATGWELVSVTYSGVIDTMYAFFKRPID